MIKKKKGVELSLNTIVIAILVIVVLAVLITIFSTQMSNLLKQIIGLGNQTQTSYTETGVECEQAGHDCVIGTNCPGELQKQSYNCGFGKVCCG